MKHYKQLLLNKLYDAGWELATQDTDTDWWLEEIWSIKSVRQNWGYELFILFLVDPLYEGNNKSQAVWAVTATTELPPDRITAENGVALMDLVKGKFDQKLSKFAELVNQHRNVVGL